MSSRSAGLILNHFFPRLPTEYVESRAFAIRPSCPAERAACRNGSISSFRLTIRRGVRNSDGTRPSRRRQRSWYGSSISVRPSTWSRSKRYSFSGTSSWAASIPWTRRNRRMRSWNGRGLPSVSTATTSPSRRNSAAGRDFAIATISGKLSVTSLSRRENMRTALPRRWIWMRAPSSLYSIAVWPPCSRRTSSRSSAISASIGFMGARSRRPRDRRPGAPSKRAISATRPRSPRNMCAVRTESASTPAASAMPSSMTPSFTPILISPKTFRSRTSRSPSDARPRRDSSRRRRALVESAPRASAIWPNRWVTSRIVSGRGTKVACFVPAKEVEDHEGPDHQGPADDLHDAERLIREEVEGGQDAPEGGRRQDRSRPHRPDRPEGIEEQDGEHADRARGEEEQVGQDVGRDRQGRAAERDEHREGDRAEDQLDL